MEHDAKVLLTCPSCNDDTLEFYGRVDHYADRDEYEPGNPLGTRGEYVVIHLDCSGCGQNSEIVTGNHKGRQYIGHFSKTRRTWPR